MSDEDKKDLMEVLPPGSALTIRQERNEIVKATVSKLRKRSERIAEAAQSAGLIEEPQPIFNDQNELIGYSNPTKPEGWSDEKFRIAVASWRPDNKVPFFIKAAVNIQKAFMAIDAAKQNDEKPSLNVNVVAMTIQNGVNGESPAHGLRVYPIKKVEE